MILDSTSISIISAIIKEGRINERALADFMSLSLQQVEYAILKIEDGLNELGLELNSNANEVSVVALEKLKEHIISKFSSVYRYSQEERILTLFLIIFCEESYLSISSFESFFGIAKNTVLSDLKEVKDQLKKQNINIGYSRQCGYHITGEEFRIRTYAMSLIQNFMKYESGRLIIMEVLKSCSKEIIGITHSIEKIEQTLRTTLSDESVALISRKIMMCLIRYRQKCIIVNVDKVYYSILGTKEYAIISEEFGENFNYNAEELLFLTSLFQSANMLFNDEVNDLLEPIAEEMIKKFQDYCCVSFNNYEELKKSLLQHLQPTYYRVLYNYHPINDLYNHIIESYTTLFEFTKLSMDPLEKVIQRKIPNEEIAYITLLFGGFLRRENYTINLISRKRAIVVCSNGVSISNFIYFTLQEIFPEFDFLQCSSLRDFSSIEERSYDLVFSTVNIVSKKPVFIVESLGSQYEYEALRKKVIAKLRFHANDNFAADLIELIGQYADVKDYQGLYGSLSRYFSFDNTMLEKERKKSPVLTALSDDKIQLCNASDSWRHSLELCARPLIIDGCIDEKYVKIMEYNISTKSPYMSIFDGFYLAHSHPNDGAHKVGLSLMKFNRPLIINNYATANVLMVLSTPNTQAHLELLFQLHLRLKEKRNRDLIIDAKTIKTLKSVIYRIFS